MTSLKLKTDPWKPKQIQARHCALVVMASIAFSDTCRAKMFVVQEFKEIFNPHSLIQHIANKYYINILFSHIYQRKRLEQSIYQDIKRNEWKIHSSISTDLSIDLCISYKQSFF